MLGTSTRFERTKSPGIASWVIAAALALVVVPSAHAQKTQYVPLDQIQQQFGNFFNPVNNSITGFFSVAERFTGTALLQRAGVPAFQGLSTNIPEFQTFANEAQGSLDGVPIPSGSISVLYAFDPKLEIFTPVERPMAPAISQDAPTNGRNMLTFGFSYSYLDYTHFNDFDHDNVFFSVSRGIPFSSLGVNVPADLIEVMYFNFKLRQQFYGFSAQYGVLDNLDVGVFIPVVQTDFKGKAVSNFFAQVTSNTPLSPGQVAFKGDLLELKNDGQLHIFRNLHDLREKDVDEVFAPHQGVSFKQSDTGIGDMVLRAKYYYGLIGPAEVGGQLAMSLPTGDEDNLEGVGSVRLDPRLIASVANALLAAHVNLGFHADTENSDLDRFDYSVGGEYRAASWMTILVDQIGRYQVQGDDIHKFEIVPGIKLNPYKNLVFGFNAIVPLNRQGLTTDWTPNGTAEVSYHF